MPSFTLKELFALITSIAFAIGLMGALVLVLNQFGPARIAIGFVLFGLSISVGTTLFLVVTAFNREPLDKA